MRKQTQTGWVTFQVEQFVMASCSACLCPPRDPAFHEQPDPGRGTPTLRRAKSLSLVGYIMGRSGTATFHFCVMVHDKPGFLDLSQVREHRRTSVRTSMMHGRWQSVISSTWHRSVGHEDGRESRWVCSCPGSITRETHVWQLGGTC